MLVKDAFSLKLPPQGPNASQAVSVEGVLIGTAIFSYICSELHDERGILIFTDPPLKDQLLQCAPVMGGSEVLFKAKCTVDGFLTNCALPMFPRAMYGLSRIVYDGRLLVQDGDSFHLEPPYTDDGPIDEDVNYFRDSLFEAKRQLDKTCKRDGCNEHPITLSLYCPQHHHDMLYG